MSPILEVRELSVSFGGLRALNAVSLAIQPGELRALIGPNGSGKSTFLNAVSGLVACSAGTIEFAGEDVTAYPTHKRAARGLFRTFQTVQLLRGSSVLENVLLGLHRQSVGRRGAWGGSEREAIARVRDVLRLLGCDHILYDEVGALPFAQQRLVEIARALVARPRLLLLDEPAVGLSPAAVEDIQRLFVALRDERKTAILLIEHMMSMVMGISDRITVLNEGAVIAEGTSKEIMSDARVKSAYLGEDDDAAGQ